MAHAAIPLFKSHYSIGRSILTLEESNPKEYNPKKPASIIDICKENKLSQLVLVDDSMSGFLEAYTNTKKENIQLVFGLRLTFCADITVKDEQSLSSNHKLIIFSKNSGGYKKLIRISSKAATDGFYYEPRMDFATLKELWSEDNLSLGVPFYDSFLHQNLLNFSSCLPDFSFTRPQFFVESNKLWIDSFLEEKVRQYCEVSDYPVCVSKSIYYKQRKDYLAYLTFRCINNRTTLDAPNLEHMTSAEFSFEAHMDGMKELHVENVSL